VNALLKCSLLDTCPKIFIATKEAEAVQLFANTYLAMRVGFFNELDKFCLSNELERRAIINGISYEPRIGKGYNNPSLGYGGYCFPKDTKRILACFQKITKLQAQSVGVYLLSMKAGSDNYRGSAVFGLIH
jgi:UDPglucose 6-dehydrogenase